MPIVAKYDSFMDAWFVANNVMYYTVGNDDFHAVLGYLPFIVLTHMPYTIQFETPEAEVKFEELSQRATSTSIDVGLASKPIQVNTTMSYTPLEATHYVWSHNRHGAVVVKTLLYLQSFGIAKRRQIIHTHMARGYCVKIMPEGIKTKEDLIKHLKQKG